MVVLAGLEYVWMSVVNLSTLRSCCECIVGYVWVVSLLVIYCQSLSCFLLLLFSSFFLRWLPYPAQSCPVLRCEEAESGRLKSAGLGVWDLQEKWRTSS